MKKSLIIICSVMIFFSVCIPVFASSTTYSWFCAHRRDNLQPRMDSSFNFIDKYDAFYIDKVHGDDCAEKVIYLTFDAGYNNGNIDTILDVLKDENVPAAFFVLGHLIEQNTELVMRMFNEGHLGCNHTFSHQKMTQKSENEFADELNKLDDLCLKCTGKNLSKYFRPPEGVFDESMLSFAKNMGYKTVFWSFAYEDWDNNKQQTCEKAKTKILDNVHNGEIILLHPTSATNAKILRDVIREIKNQGYRFGSLDEIQP